MAKSTINEKRQNLYLCIINRRCIRRQMNSSKRYFVLSLILFSMSVYYYLLTSPNLIQVNNQSSNSTRIMYVIRTSSKFYKTRLKYLLQTWISFVPKDAYFTTDQHLPNISTKNFVLTKNVCGNESHTMKTLCCKTAHDFVLYHRHINKYDWFCHFDDDQYVNIHNLEKYLSTLDPKRPYYIGRNSWNSTLKRSKKPYPYPFWFATLGAGVCLSKHLVYRLKPLTGNITQFVNGCLKENYHDDIYLGFLISNYLNVTLTKNLHFHSHLEKDFYSDKRKFLETFSKDITFGFRYPHRYPAFLPDLYEFHLDFYRIRTLHCLLYPHISECQTKIHQHLLNVTI